MTILNYGVKTEAERLVRRKELPSNRPTKKSRENVVFQSKKSDSRSGKIPTIATETIKKNVSSPLLKRNEFFIIQKPEDNIFSSSSRQEKQKVSPLIHNFSILPLFFSIFHEN